MSAWLDIAQQIEPLDGVPLDPVLIVKMAQRQSERDAPSRIHFYTPSFKTYATSEIAACGKSAWPAISITGGECQLACDHCKARRFCRSRQFQKWRRF